MQTLLSFRAACVGLFLFLAGSTSVHAQCTGRDDGFKLLFGLCGGVGQRACANLPSCSSPCKFDGSTARCQLPVCPTPGSPGRNDGLCFSLGPCGAPGQRSCASQPFCIAPATFDSATAKCQNQALCPAPGTPGRNDGNCFSLGACGGPGQRSCANQPFCVAPATFDSATAKCQNQALCPAPGTLGRNDGNCFSLGACGAPGQRSCANLPFCVDGAAFDTATAKCQVLKTCLSANRVIGRDDGLCSTSGPCGYPGQRSCQNFPGCVAPATFDSGSAKCQDASTCPANYQLGRNDGLCFVGLGGPCGGPGERACGTTPSCAPNLTFDAATLTAGLPTCQPTKTSCPANTGPGSDDVTFFVATDLHFGKPTFNANSQSKHVSVMNAFGASGTPWPTTYTFSGGQSGSGTFSGRNNPLAVPRGLVTTGDLTHYGQVEELGEFRAFYENGNQFPGSIKFPVYVGLGNHDVYGTCSQPVGPSSCAERMFNYVETRMKGCGSVTDFDPGSRSYAWDWGQVHLVQLHTWAGDTVFGGASDNNGNPPATHPDGLQWLANDLRNAVGTSGRPVVLFQHYGYDPFSLGLANGEVWWTAANQATFHNIIKDYNVVALFSGHGHAPQTGLYPVSLTDSKGNKKTLWNFSGSTGGEGDPANKGTDQTANPEGSFFAVHITPSFMDVAQWQWSSTSGGTPLLKQQGANCSRMVAGADVTSNVKLSWDGFRFDTKTGMFFQTVGIMNTGTTPIRGSLSLVVDGLSSNATLMNPTGKVDCSALANQYVDVAITGEVLAPGQSTSATLQFSNSGNQPIRYSARVFGVF